MFNRRKLLITLCVLACLLLAAGFLGFNLLGWGALPLLASLYAEGWWTLLLIFPALTMFALDGYSRPALGLLASGLLLFANTHGVVDAGMFEDAVFNTVFATVLGGATVEITAKSSEKRKKKLLLAEKNKKSLDDKTVQSPKTSQPKTSQAPRPQQSQAAKPQQAQQTPPPSPQPKPQQASTFKQTSSDAQKKNTYSRPSASSWGSAAHSQSAPSAAEPPKKGWDPNRSYRNPKDRRISSAPPMQRQQPATPVKKSNSSAPSPWVQRQKGVSASNSYPQCIAFFGSSKVFNNHQDLAGGLVVSLFGNAQLTLRDADYNQPITLSILSLFGSSKVEVPYVSNIALRPVSLFGECKDKRNLVNSNAMPQITIRCISLFGDCRIL